MAPKRAKSTNTIANVVAARSKRGMRQNISGRLGNSTVLKGTELLTSATISGTGTDYTNVYPLIAGSTYGRAVYTFINVAKNFQKFVYMPGTMLRYQPNCGLNTAGTVYVAYVDNPEIIKDFTAAAATPRMDIVRGQANMKSYPVWQEFTHAIGNSRLKTYSTDVTTDLTDSDTINRVCQGAFLIGIEGTSQTGTTTYGRLALFNNLRLDELSATPPT